MLRLLQHRTFAALFAAQVVALVGTGLLTVALGLLAFDLAGAAAGAVLGTAFAIKMVAYVGIAPLAQAIANRLPRKTVLVGADIVRAAIALGLPFVDAVWQVYVLIFVLQAASATFTPTFQATILDILPDEDDYTRALSLSRLAYDLESLLSPALAGVLLLVMGYHWLFIGTVIGFLASTLLVWRAALPAPSSSSGHHGFVDRLTRGTRIYLSTPRLRGVLALSLAVASAGAFVLVNTVVLVKQTYGGSDTAVAIALAAFGGGSMAAALILPSLLRSVNDRSVMLSAALVLAGILLAHGVWAWTGSPPAWGIVLLAWAVAGAMYSAVQTPTGRLLRRSAQTDDRAAVFAAQFALSHACWLVTYPAAGWIGQAFGLSAAMLALGGLALGGTIAAVLSWPREDPAALDHDHPDLPPDHPHLRAHGGGRHHRHVFVIDDQHRHWPVRL